MLVSIRMPTVSPRRRSAQQSARKHILIDAAVPMQCPVMPDQTIEITIVQIANHDLKRVAMNGMNEGANLPASEMGREEQHAFVLLARRRKIFEPVIDRDLGNVFPRIARELGKLRQQPPKRKEDPAQDSEPLPPGHFRKGQFEVAHAHPPQAWIEVKKTETDRHPHTARRPARQHP